MESWEVDILIDEEFKEMIPDLSKEERDQLEANILSDGCRDPLSVWVQDTCYCHECESVQGYRTETDFIDGRYKDFYYCLQCNDFIDEGPHAILVDGHNRKAICEAHDIGFGINIVEFESREEAKDWIDENQLGRRNLTPDAFKLLLGRRYNRQKVQGFKGNQHTSGAGQIDQKQTSEKLAERHSVSEATVRRAGKFAEEVEKTPELKNAIQERKPVLQVKRELKEKKREQRRQENASKIAEAKKPEEIKKTGAKFATIAIDPPWDWNDEGDCDQLGRAKPDYTTMSIDQLHDLPVGDLADDDCHIYMWITNRSLPKGFDLLEAWGFRYITALTWVKPHFGMGNYFRGQTEHVLFGVKGSQPLKRKDVGTVFNAARGEGGHSSKPVEFYELVESCSPGPYLEMFSRKDRDGWVMWGESA